MMTIGHSEAQGKSAVAALEPPPQAAFGLYFTSYQAALINAGLPLIFQVPMLTRLTHFLHNLPDPQPPTKLVFFGIGFLWGERNRRSIHWGATSRRRHHGFV